MLLASFFNCTAWSQMVIEAQKECLCQGAARGNTATHRHMQGAMSELVMCPQPPDVVSEHDLQNHCACRAVAEFLLELSAELLPTHDLGSMKGCQRYRMA